MKKIIVLFVTSLMLALTLSNCKDLADGLTNESIFNPVKEKLENNLSYWFSEIGSSKPYVRVDSVTIDDKLCENKDCDVIVTISATALSKGRLTNNGINFPGLEIKGADEKHLSAGEKIEFTGKIKFKKFDSGWRLNADDGADDGK